MSSVILLGAPGSGKGTIAKYLKKYWNVPHISTGDIFRTAIKNKTNMGIKANEYLKDGKLVPDDITVGVVEERFKEYDIEKGFILDGFPRTVNQAVQFDRVLLSLLKELKAVILLKVDDIIIIDRITGRRVCESCGKIYHVRNIPSKKEGICDDCNANLIQRKDDNEIIIKDRLLEYNKLTAPLIDYYKNRNLLIEIDASTNPEAMLDKIKGLDF
jgi:adenylate kinase